MAVAPEVSVEQVFDATDAAPCVTVFGASRAERGSATYEASVAVGAALARLCRMLNVKPNEVMACGDGLNDLGMIELAGLGVVVGNARQAVRDHADIVCASNADEGIAQLIESMTANTHA